MKDVIKSGLLLCTAILAVGCGSDAAPESSNPGQMSEGGATGAGPSGQGGQRQNDDDDLPEYCGWPNAPAPLWRDLGNPSLLAVDATRVYWANTQELGNQDVPEPGIYSAPLGGGEPKKLTALTGRVQALEALGDDLVYAYNGHLYALPKQGGEPTEIETPEPADERLGTYKQLVRDGDDLFALSRKATCVAAKETAVLRLNLATNRAELVINVEQCITDFAVDETHFYWTSPGVVARQGRTAELPQILTEEIPNEYNHTVSGITLWGDSVFLLEHGPSADTLKSLPKTGGVPSDALFSDELIYFVRLVTHGDELFGLACGGAFAFSPETAVLRPLATGMTILSYGDIAVTDSAVFASASGNVWRLDRE